jgi:hypothetical protein
MQTVVVEKSTLPLQYRTIHQFAKYAQQTVSAGRAAVR